MDKNRLIILESELADQIKVIDEVYEKIEKRRPSFKESEEGIESMAYQLHNLYGAYEELFEIVASYFENELGGAKYHSDLLKRMNLVIKGVRPQLISDELYKLFDELRRFRHLFRHAYGMELNPEMVERICDITDQIRKKFKQELSHFLKILRERLK